MDTCWIKHGIPENIRKKCVIDKVAVNDVLGDFVILCLKNSVIDKVAASAVLGDSLCDSMFKK